MCIGGKRKQRAVPRLPLAFQIGCSHDHPSEHTANGIHNDSVGVAFETALMSHLIEIG